MLFMVVLVVEEALDVEFAKHIECFILIGEPP